MSEKTLRDTVNVRGVHFDNVTMDEAFAKAVELLSADGFDYFVTPNPEIVQACIEQNALYEVVNGASLTVPDGIGVLYAAKILGTPLKEKVAGVELAEKLVAYCAENHVKVFFFGAAPKTAEHEAVWKIAGEKLSEKYPGLDYAGRDGFFDEAENEDILREIDDSGAKLLLVCLGAPKQEKWLYKYGRRLKNVTLAGGLGGSLDVFAGVAERAPEAYLKHNAEWLYRLKKNPKRIGRMMKLPKFLVGTVLHGKRDSMDQ